MRLRSYLVLLVLTPLVPLLAFSAVVVSERAVADRTAIAGDLLTAARSVSAALDDAFDASIRTLRVLATSVHLDTGGLEAFHDQAIRVQTANPEWLSISLFDLSGQRLVYTPAPFGKPLPPRPGVMAARFRVLVETQQPGVSDLFPLATRKGLGFSVGAPVVRDGHVRYVLSAGLDGTAVAAILARQRLPAPWTLTLIDRQGVIAAQSGSPGRIGEQATGDWAARAGSTAEGTARGVTTEGVPVYTAFSRSPRFGWTARLAAPATAIDAAAMRPVWTVMGVGVGLVLAGALLAVWVGRVVDRSVQALVVEAARLGQGAAPRPVPSIIHEAEALSASLVAAGGERARAEDERARYAQRLRILHEVDRGLIAEATPVQIAGAVVRPLRELLGLPRAIVNVFDLPAGEVEWLAAAGRRRVRLGPGIRYPLRLAGDLDGLRRGEPQVIDVDALPPSPEADALRASGVHVYVVVPMLAAGELVGSVILGAASGPFPPEHVSIAQEVADQLAIALTQARLHERVTRQAEELEGRVEARTRELSAANQRLERESDERQRAEAEAARANHAKSEFLSRMSHELRTPLNGILGFAQLLELEGLASEHQDSVAQILRAGRHLLGLIDEVLDISRIETGGLRLSLEPVAVDDVVRAAVEMVQRLAADLGIAVRAEPFPDARHVLADRQRLVQVLLNLLSNGVKYNRVGGTVVVAGEMADRGHWRIRVTDTGPGIAPDKLGRLFTPFDRLGAEVTGVEGTGLGLALSKHLIEVMGGTLQVSSQLGAGSTFAVELPMAEAPIEAALPRPWAPVPGRAEPGPAQAVILYVEDNLANLRLVERIVARRPGVTLLSAMQGQMGVDLAREHHPDLILLDQHLPDMAGDAVIGLLRADPRTRGIPIVMLSADASPRQIQRLRELGARDYLTKPLDVTRLLALLDDTIARVKAASAPK